MDDLKRWASLILAGLVGGGVSVGYAFLTWPAALERGKGLSKSDGEWHKQVVVLETCIFFFAALYWSGRLFARLFRAGGLADEIKDNSRWHLGALHLLLGSSILFSRGFVQGKGAGGPMNTAMIALGVVLFLSAFLFFVRWRNQA